jgi:hypothetical protein
MYLRVGVCIYVCFSYVYLQGEKEEMSTRKMGTPASENKNGTMQKLRTKEKKFGEEKKIYDVHFLSSFAVYKLIIRNPQQ